MNILITYISKLPLKEPDEITYNTQKAGGSADVKGILSVEPVVKLLAAENAVDRIIALVSDEVKNSTNNYKNETACDYFKSVVTEATGKDDIMIPVYESADGSEKPLGAIISEICGHISSDDDIYIDTTGGPRKTTNLIQLLTKILRYKGINNPCSYYASIQKRGTIETTEEFTELTTLADAVNEFVTVGLSDQLRKCMANETRACPSLAPLLDSMKDFTDNIRLCYVEQLDSVLDRLEKALTDFENEKQPYTETKAIILRQLTPVIREKFFKSGRDSDGNIVSIIEWCLDNGLVQQALTIFTEKIPVYLFRNGIFTFDDTVVDRCKKKKSSLDSAHMEVNVFYQDLMSRTKSMVILVCGLSEKGVSRLTSTFSQYRIKTAPDSDFKLLTALFFDAFGIYGREGYIDNDSVLICGILQFFVPEVGLWFV